MDELKRYYQLQFPTDTITVARVQFQGEKYSVDYISEMNEFDG